VSSKATPATHIDHCILDVGFIASTRILHSMQEVKRRSQIAPQVITYGEMAIAA
jgi:hypothetical protein